MMDATDLVTDFPVLSRLTPEQLARVRSSATTAHYAAGEQLFTEGEPAVGCWLIHTGRIALDVLVPGRGLVVVQTLGAGDILGWSWLVPPYRWQFGATAAEPTTATVLNTAQLRLLAEEDPRFGYALATTLFGAVLQRLQATRARLLDLYRSPRDQH